MSIKTLLADQIRLRDSAIAQWEAHVKEIQVNPIQMNIRGIWIDDFLEGLMSIRREVLFRDEIIHEIEQSKRRTCAKRTKR